MNLNRPLHNSKATSRFKGDGEDARVKGKSRRALGRQPRYRQFDAQASWGAACLRQAGPPTAGRPCCGGHGMPCPYDGKVKGAQLKLAATKASATSKSKSTSTSEPGAGSACRSNRHRRPSFGGQVLRVNCASRNSSILLQGF